MPASGTFGFGWEASKLYDINRLGAVVTKGTTRRARAGNQLPRVTDCPAGMLNAVGLENPGAEHVLSTELPFLGTLYGGPIIANVCGFSVDEYAYVAERLSQSPHVAALEINISCPNVEGGGMSFGTDAHIAAEITRAVRKATQKPIFLKLSPNVTDITEIARACEAEGADALTLINTLLGMRFDLQKRRPILANTTGGLSGPAIFPIALRMVYQVYQAVKIPIVGVGGISSARDVIEMMIAGASAVQIGSAALVNPAAVTDILDALPAELEAIRAGSLWELIGASQPPGNRFINHPAKTAVLAGTPVISRFVVRKEI
jgi:dihydroorotate dehydrogenase (NAD+) catalytic subunit